MKLLFVTLTVFCVIPESLALAQPFIVPEGVTHYCYPPDGAEYASTITPKMRDLSPDWADTEPNPPVSARKAMMLAEATVDATLKDKVPPSYKRSRASVNLLPLAGRKWCWEICYEWHDVSVGGETGGLFGFRVFVLMDGKVVQPVKNKARVRRQREGVRTIFPANCSAPCFSLTPFPS